MENGKEPRELRRCPRCNRPMHMAMEVRGEKWTPTPVGYRCIRCDAECGPEYMDGYFAAHVVMSAVLETEKKDETWL